MPFARALPVSIRQVGQSTARAVNQWRLVPPELLTALSRSRHFEGPENGIGADFSPWVAACRSLISRQRSESLLRTGANPFDYTSFRRETPRRESRGRC